MIESRRRGMKPLEPSPRPVRGAPATRQPKRRTRDLEKEHAERELQREVERGFNRKLRQEEQALREEAEDRKTTPSALAGTPWAPESVKLARGSGDERERNIKAARRQGPKSRKGTGRGRPVK